MPADSDLLFGKIAVARGFCTEEQVDACVKAQASSKDPMPLGKLLVSEGHLTDSQYSTILEIQRQKLLAPNPIGGANLDAALFGKLVVRRGLLTEAQVNECLRVQAQEGDERSLGEVIVSKHYMSPHQVKAILAEQCKTIMNCPPCGLSFTILSTTARKLVDCPRCKQPLEEGKPSESTRTDGEIETRIAKALKSEVVADSTEPSKGDRPVSRLTCKMCSHQFEGVIDSTNRVRCPMCDTRYVVRQTPP